MRLARLLLVLCVVFCAAQPARAETAGQVLAAVGDVLALRAGQIIRLLPGAGVESGDEIHTGVESYVQIRFTDWGLIWLRPRTGFVVEDYAYEARKGGRERAYFNLLNGGIRSLTGLIGHRDRGNYRLRTVTATIGIRGTHYTVLLCRRDCRNPDGTLGADGLYGEVIDGRIAVSPRGGSALEREFGAGERFRLVNEHSVPAPLFSVPPFFPDKLDSLARSAGKPATPIPPVGGVLPGGNTPGADPVPGVTGGLEKVLGSIVPAKPGAGPVSSAAASVSGSVIAPLANGVVLPAERLAGSVVNSALSMPALGPVFPLAGSALNAVPAVVAPVLAAVNGVVAGLPPVTLPVIPPVTLPGVPPVTVPGVPPVALPGVPPVTVPGVPPVTVPGVPPVTTPSLPPVTTPTLPPVTTPTLPPVTVPTLPPVTAPTLPPVTTPTLPPATLPPVTTPTLPPVTVPTLPPVTAPTLPPVTSPIVTPVVAPPTNTVSLPTVPSLPVAGGLRSPLLKK